MNRFHVHLNVSDLASSIRFYSELFGTRPALTRHDYAKWMLEDPRINFAISSTGRAPGIDHLGMQVDSSSELAALGQRLKAAGNTMLPEDATVCCYARSDKMWAMDPQGTRWETFHTFGEATTCHGLDAECAANGPTCAPGPGLTNAPATGHAHCEPKSRCC